MRTREFVATAVLAVAFAAEAAESPDAGIPAEISLDGGSAQSIAAPPEALPSPPAQLSTPAAPRDADLVVGLPLLRVVRFPGVTSHVPTWDEAVATHADLFLLSHYLVERSTEPIPIPWL